MLASRCSFSPSTALQRVFLSGLNSPIATTTLTPIHLAIRPCGAYTTSAASANRPSPTHLGARSNPTITTCRSYAKFVRTSKQKQKNQIANNNIPYQWVRVKKETQEEDEEGDNSLGPAERTDDILRNLDFSRYSLVMLAPPPPPQPGEQSAAICKIVDLEQEARRRAEQQKEARVAKANTKELEFNWAIAKGDMDMKLNRMTEFLQKGMRVEVTLAKKRGSRAATVQEAEQLIASVQEAAQQVKHSKVIKKPDGIPGKVVRMSFEGPSKKMRENMAANAVEAEARAQARAEEQV